MLIAERQSRAQNLIAERGMCDLDTLARELDVSQSTVRRDVEQLEQQGLVRRTHGGVIWVGDRNGAAGRPYAFDQRLTYRQEAKQRIARAASALVEPGQTVLLDGGTTVYHLAEELLNRRLQIVTNSLPIANRFINDESTELVLTGGLLYPRYGVLLGPASEAMIASVHPKIMFFSIAGLHDGMLYNQNLLLVEAERKMMQQAQEVALLVDSTKFGQQALVRLCGLSEVDIVVTDNDISPPAREAIESAGCRLIVG